MTPATTYKQPPGIGTKTALNADMVLLAAFLPLLVAISLVHVAETAREKELDRVLSFLSSSVETDADMIVIWKLAKLMHRKDSSHE